MKFEATPLRDVYLLKPQVFGDERGFFMESWNQELFSEHGFDIHFVQDNHSRSARGILRGMHYQTEHTQGAHACIHAVHLARVDLLLLGVECLFYLLVRLARLRRHLALGGCHDYPPLSPGNPGFSACSW